MLGRARKSDPITSKLAAFGVDADKICGLVYTAIKKSGTRGLTTEEMSTRIDYPLNSISPRPAQLEKKGLIIRKISFDGCEPKMVTRPSMRGKQQIVWVAK